MIDAAPTTSRPGGARHVNRLAGRFASRHDILDHQDPFSGGERETTPQHQLAVLPLGEDGANAERARDFLTDDNAAERRRQHDLGVEATQAGGDFRSTGLGLGRVLQHQRTLHVTWTVQS